MFFLLFLLLFFFLLLFLLLIIVRLFYYNRKTVHLKHLHSKVLRKLSEDGWVKASSYQNRVFIPVCFVFGLRRWLVLHSSVILSGFILLRILLLSVLLFTLLSFEILSILINDRCKVVSLLFSNLLNLLDALVKLS